MVRREPEAGEEHHSKSLSHSALIHTRWLFCKKFKLKRECFVSGVQRRTTAEPRSQLRTLVANVRASVNNTSD